MHRAYFFIGFKMSRSNAIRWGGEYRVQGSALITALLISVLCALFGSALILSERLLIHQTVLLYNSDMLMPIIKGVQYWTEYRLANSNIIYPMPQLQVDVGEIRVRADVQGEHGLFNINSLSDKNNFPYFDRLLIHEVPFLSREKRVALTWSIYHWLHAGYQKENYLQFDPPYQAAHQPLFMISELRLVAGITAPIYEALQLDVTALPSSENLINVNEASEAVLSSLIANSSHSVKAVMSCRDAQAPFDSVDSFISHCGFGVISKDHLTVDENNFFVLMQAKKSQQKMLVRLFLDRRHDQSGFHFTVAWQEINRE